MHPSPGTIYQGDCLDYMRAWPDKHFDWVITDPPYGQKICSDGTHGHGAGRRGFNHNIQHGVCAWDSARPSPAHFAELLRVSRNQIIFGGNFFADLLPPHRCWICWDKGRRGLDLADGELIWTSMDAPMRMINYHHNQMMANLATEPRVHPTQKPLPVMEWLISKYTHPDDLILDCFAGSGTTLTAAERLGRRWVGIELSEEYCAIARKRTAQRGLFVSESTTIVDETTTRGEHAAKN